MLWLPDQSHRVLFKNFAVFCLLQRHIRYVKCWCVRLCLCERHQLIYNLDFEDIFIHEGKLLQHFLDSVSFT